MLSRMDKVKIGTYKGPKIKLKKGENVVGEASVRFRKVYVLYEEQIQTLKMQMKEFNLLARKILRKKLSHASREGKDAAGMREDIILTQVRISLLFDVLALDLQEQFATQNPGILVDLRDSWQVVAIEEKDCGDPDCPVHGAGGSIKTGIAV